MAAGLSAAGLGAANGALASAPGLIPAPPPQLTQTAYEQPNLSALGQLSIEDLANLPVTSVAKRAEPISQAPAAIYVITHDDIERSGATSIPEALRLAPNLQVAQLSSGKYVITARGFSGNQADQSFTNKLLVLIDGRSVYTPLYSGVYWDMQDVPPADIDRIEVISGPGATLWGANAVNGVINIITRASGDTQGAVLDVGAGNLQQSASIRYGGKISDSLTYRVYAKTFFDRDTVTAANSNGGDHWSKPQAGFRMDWIPSKADAFTLQGDGYEGADAQLGAADEIITGANLSGRWNHSWQDGSALQVQAYYDRNGRKTEAGGGSFNVNTYDLDIQHSFNLDARNQVVWGGGLRANQFRIDGTASLLFAPPDRTLDMANLFAQDTFAVMSYLKATLGLKLEDDPYSGLQVLPDLRLSWTPTTEAMLWAAASRSVRSPTPFDRDVLEKSGPTVLLHGDAAFRPERLTAYETGARFEFGARASVSVSAYYNLYDDLHSIEVTPVTVFPLTWGNGIAGYTEGLEAWGDLRLASWWRVSPGLNLISEHLAFRQGSSGVGGLAQVGDDPQTQGSLKSSMDFGRRVTFDADLRYQGVLPNPHLPAYVELNSRVGWRITPRLQLALSGFNLLHPRHQELPTSQANAVPRSAYVSLRWGF